MTHEPRRTRSCRGTARDSSDDGKMAPMTPPLPRLLVVGALLQRGKRVLLARRAEGSQHGGLWEFPGGKVEAGETQAEALRRELREELDVHVRVLGPYDRVLVDQGQRGLDLRVLRCAITEGEPKALWAAELGWFTTDELSALPTPPADAPIRDRLVRDGLPEMWP